MWCCLKINKTKPATHLTPAVDNKKLLCGLMHNKSKANINEYMVIILIISITDKTLQYNWFNILFYPNFPCIVKNGRVLFDSISIR